MAAELLCHYNGIFDIGVPTHLWMSGSKPIFRDHVPLSEARNLRVADLIMVDQCRWNIRKITELFEPASARQIKGIELPTSLKKRDEQFWPYCKSGKYNTKSGYAILLHQQTKICSMASTSDRKFFRVLWGLRIMHA